MADFRLHERTQDGSPISVSVAQECAGRKGKTMGWAAQIMKVGLVVLGIWSFASDTAIAETQSVPAIAPTPAPADQSAGPDGATDEEGEPEAEPSWLIHETAVLQGLDKVTARISTIEAPIDRPVRFGALEIVVRTCQNRPPTETPENAAFLQIDERLPDAPVRRVFSGWMFASSPALNALEHPVYDVWVQSCKSAETAAESSSEQSN